MTGESYSAVRNLGNQIPGLFVSSGGRLKPESTAGGYICRWSFRRMIAFGRWSPDQPDSDIKDGDQVRLFCHSIGLGSYTDYERPPLRASSVKYHAGADQLICLGFGDPLGGGWDRAHKFDEGKLSAEEIQDAYSDDERNARILGAVTAFGTNRDADRLSSAEREYWDGGWREALFTVNYVYNDEGHEAVT